MFRNLKTYITHPQYNSLGLVFGLMSVIFTFWVTRVPELKIKLDLSESELGLSLLFIPIGSILAMFTSSGVINKTGAGKATVYTVVYSAITSIFPLLAASLPGFCFTLFLLGLGVGWVEVAANAVVGILEQKNNVKIMSTSHGFFSLGGILGALVGGLLAGWGVPALPHFCITTLVIVIILLVYVRPRLSPVKDANVAEGPVFAFPGRALAGMAVVGFCVLLSEGALADWSAVYLREILPSNQAYMAGFGYAAFSVMMTLGRFNGDFIIEKAGNKKVLLVGLILASAGTFLLVTAGFIPVLIGFILAGAGYSCVVPVIFSYAASNHPVSSAHGIASLAGTGFSGFLVGPVAIGFIAEYYGLANSFYLLFGLTVLSLGVVFGNRRL